MSNLKGHTNLALEGKSQYPLKKGDTGRSQFGLAQLGKLIGFLLFFLGFLLAIHLITESLKLFGTSLAEQLVNITANPFISLFIGILATALIQSSSTTTTLIVSLVAANGLTLEGAIPMIMGANVGTAVTSTLVALGYFSNKDEFQQGIAAASLHDFFNIFTALILFILELTTHFLSSTAKFLAEGAAPISEGKWLNPINFLKIISTWILEICGNIPWIGFFVGLFMLFICLRGLSRLLRVVVIGRIQRNLNLYVFENPVNGFLMGLGTTLLLQSSSVTTSLMVPLVATGRVSLKNVFPFLIGANVGTTSTALLAGLFTPSLDTEAALGVAFVHVIFNVIGLLMIFPFPIIRKIPLSLATYLGMLTQQNRLYGVAYVVLVFFAIPFFLIFVGGQ